jgi:hypothetical protein
MSGSPLFSRSDIARSMEPTEEGRRMGHEFLPLRRYLGDPLDRQAQELVGRASRDRPRETNVRRLNPQRAEET